MDPDRQIRFAIPPFFLFFSILVGVFLSNNPLRDWLTSVEGPRLLAVGTAIAASTLPVGFVISSITFLLLRLCFLPTGRSFETFISPVALMAVWPSLKTTLQCEQKWHFESVVTLDHELLSSGMHSWIMRRWNAFLISTQACVALSLAHVVAQALSLEQPCLWFVGSLCIGGILALNAIVAWRGTMKMLEFQAFRLRSSQDSSFESAANPAAKSDAA
jgi:hypothetical protein